MFPINILLDHIYDIGAGTHDALCSDVDKPAKSFRQPLRSLAGKFTVGAARGVHSVDKSNPFGTCLRDVSLQLLLPGFRQPLLRPRPRLVREGTIDPSHRMICQGLKKRRLKSSRNDELHRSTFLNSTRVSRSL